MKSIYFVFLLSLGAMVSCSSSQKIKKISASPKAQITNFEDMREDFDPASVGDYDIDIEDEQVPVDYQDSYDLDTVQSPGDSIGTGYRVQLIQTGDPEEAKNVQRDAILRFDGEVYRVFDPPFYKVRIGDFADWYQAEKLQKLAIQKGFKEAWVIRTKVNLKKAYHWLDEM